jgi:DNA-binding NtrC family response regulator
MKKKVDNETKAMRSFFMESRKVKTKARKGMIVLVEDDPEAVEVVKELVGNRACLIPFSSIEETKSQIAKLGFDGVLSVVLDFYLPDGTGVELAGWLDEQCPGLPMFLISSDIAMVKKVSRTMPNLTPVKKWELGQLDEALGI